MRSPLSLLFQAKQSQVPQPLPISLVLQTLPQLRCPSLDTLQPLNVSLGVGGPTLNTAFEVRPHQCRVQGTITALVLLATLFLIQARMPLAFLGTWAHCWLIFTQPSTNTPRSFSARQLSSHSSPSLPSIQPVQVPLQSLPTLQQINTPAQLGVICKLTESTLDPFVQIIDKDVKQNWPQHRALGNTACDRPPTGVNSIHHHSLGPAVQPVLYPAKSTPVQAMSSQFLQENAPYEIITQQGEKERERACLIGKLHFQGLRKEELIKFLPAVASAADGRIRIQIIHGRLEKWPEIDKAGIQHREQNLPREEGSGAKSALRERGCGSHLSYRVAVRRREDQLFLEEKVISWGKM
ncbi:hypothetical protein QYF61_005972 [Mycteria americana]|uniref:Uncharacterized protein n=1 Tax=Mycteria americana TaxID=33587 RepID=A0AAN7NQH3_MYCAM|nr:hypothetical protein QYF61_005972 [Mycteria americana]